MAIEEISVTDLAALGPGIRLVDVREEWEFDEARVAYAANIPMGTVPDRLDDLGDGPLYVMCRSGGRSYRVCEYLDGHGLDVVNVSGGMLAWGDAGLDTVSGS